MSEITPVTPKPIGPNAKDYADQTDIIGKATEFLSNVSALFANSSVNVTTMPGRTDQSGTPNGPTTIPSLDNPDDIKQLEENLEALIAYLAAVEGEVTAVRMILTGRLAGIASDTIRERLRDFYA